MPWSTNREKNKVVITNIMQPTWLTGVLNQHGSNNGLATIHECNIRVRLCTTFRLGTQCQRRWPYSQCHTRNSPVDPGGSQTPSLCNRPLPPAGYPRLCAPPPPSLFNRRHAQYIKSPSPNQGVNVDREYHQLDACEYCLENKNNNSDK